MFKLVLILLCMSTAYNVAHSAFYEKLEQYAKINDYLEANVTTLDVDENLQAASGWLDILIYGPANVQNKLLAAEVRHFVHLQKARIGDNCNIDIYDTVTYNYNIVKTGHTKDPAKFGKINKIVDDIAVEYAEKCAQHFISRHSIVKDDESLNRIFKRLFSYSKPEGVDFTYNISVDLETIRGLYTGDQFFESILPEIKYDNLYESLWRKKGVFQVRKFSKFMGELIVADQLMEPCGGLTSARYTIFEPALKLMRIANPNKILRFSGNNGYDDLLIEFQYCLAIRANRRYVTEETVNAIKRNRNAIKKRASKEDLVGTVSEEE